MSCLSERRLVVAVEIRCAKTLPLRLILFSSVFLCLFPISFSQHLISEAVTQSVYAKLVTWTSLILVRLIAFREHTLLDLHSSSFRLFDTTSPLHLLCSFHNHLFLFLNRLFLGKRLRLLSLLLFPLIRLNLINLIVNKLFSVRHIYQNKLYK